MEPRQQQQLFLMESNGLVPNEQRIEKVEFTKPFMYMIWDNINQIPIFMGTVCNPTVAK